MTNKNKTQPKLPEIPKKSSEPPFTEPKEPVIKPAEVPVRNPEDNPLSLPETPPLPRK